MSTSTMYKMKPVFEFPTSFRHTSTMYKMKPLQFIRAAEKSNAISQGTGPDEMLLWRQEKLLDKLSELKDEIDKVRGSVEKLKANEDQFRKKAANAGISSKINYQNLYKDIGKRAIIIRTSKKNIPTSVDKLNKIWEDLPIRVTVYYKSPMEAMLEPQPAFDYWLTNSGFHTLYIKIQMIVLPENECKYNDIEFEINSISSKSIIGEVNLIKLFDKYVDSESILDQTIKDHYFDIAHRLAHVGKGAKLNLCTKLIEYLANDTYFSREEKPNVVDLAIWCSVNKIQNQIELPEIMKKWYQKCNTYFGDKN